jgi:hypothetical protein
VREKLSDSDKADSANLPAVRFIGAEMQEDRERPEPPSTHSDQHDQVDKKPGIHGLISSANKGLLAAVGTGIAGVITAAVIGAPHWVQDKLTTPAATVPINVTGGPIAQNKDGGTCDIGGEYTVGPPVPKILPPSLTVDALRNWLNASAASDGGETDYALQLQGAQGRNVLVTEIHTVIDRRTPAGADRNSIDVDGGQCGGGGWADEFDVTIDLDQHSPVPDIVDRATNAHPKRFLSYVATNDYPVLITVSAKTTKNDVIWHLKIDYVVDGKVGTILIPAPGRSFHTIAPLGTTKYKYSYDYDTKLYSLKAG